MYPATEGEPWQLGPNGQAALSYARLGWRVLPLWPFGDGRCTCRSGVNCADPGKHPRVRRGVGDATANLKQVWDWWWAWPDANVAVATGRESGIIVLDVDPRNRGDKTMEALCAELGPLPPGPTVETGGGGWHLYFQVPNGVALKPKAGPGVDVQAEKSYVVAPPSRTGDSKNRQADRPPHRWVVRPEECPPPPLPPAWLVKITKPNVLEFIGDGAPLDTLLGGDGGSVTGPLPAHIEESIQTTIPQTVGVRFECLKRFLVSLKLHPKLAAAPVDSIRPYVRQWHWRAGRRARTKKFGDTWREARALWPKTDPRKQSIMRVAAVAFQQEPPAFAVERGYKPELVKLVLLCRGLQEVWGEEPFHLDCRGAAGLIGVKKSTAANYLNRLRREKVLQRVRKGRFGTGLSSDYRYLGVTGGERG